MRRIAIINQKGGVGKTTTAVNLGAALARLDKRVLVIDMDPQANASMNVGAELHPGEPSTYSILTQGGRVADTIRGTSEPRLSILPAHLDLSGAELELASAIGRETILKDALDDWEREEIALHGREPVDIILMDNPPSLGLLSVNGLAAAKEVLIAVQTEFFALQGLSKLVEIVQLLRRRLNPDLEITAVLACLYDSRLRLAREVLGELRAHFPDQLFKRPIAQNVKLAETPSFGRTIFEYAPESKGAEDYLAVAKEFLAREEADPDPPGGPSGDGAHKATDQGHDAVRDPVAGSDPKPELSLPDEPPTLSDVPSAAMRASWVPAGDQVKGAAALMSPEAPPERTNVVEVAQDAAGRAEECVETPRKEPLGPTPEAAEPVPRVRTLRRVGGPVPVRDLCGEERTGRRLPSRFGPLRA